MNNQVQKQHWVGAVVEFLSSALVMVAVVLGIRAFVIQPFRVDGQSMEPTLENREYILVDKLSFRLRQPKRDDVVIFNPDKSRPELAYVKRVIGLPGDRVVVAGGRVKIYDDQYPSGQVINEPYLAPGTQTLVDNDLSHKLDLTLGPNQYFLLGDNRQHSYDSRALGVVDQSQLVGKAGFIILPVSAAGSVK